MAHALQENLADGRRNDRRFAQVRTPGYDCVRTRSVEFQTVTERSIRPDD